MFEIAVRHAPSIYFDASRGRCLRRELDFAMSLSVPPTPLFLPVPPRGDGQERGHADWVSAVSGSAKQDRFLRVGGQIA